MSTAMRELTKQEYEATYSPPMVEVTNAAEEIVDLWAYADPIIEEKYHSCPDWEWRVMYIYESRDGAYQHILIPVPQNNAYMSVVVDKPQLRIVGHYLLDLEQIYPERAAQ